ncbi:unnamed protein product, partial [marine sediment metagenome]
DEIALVNIRCESWVKQKKLVQLDGMVLDMVVPLEKE